MLEKRDIKNLVVLGEKTIQLIITTVYGRINKHKELKKFDKGMLTRYIRKFFMTINQTVDYLIPK